MSWVLLWIVLLLAAVLVLGLLGRTVWRKAKALTAEVTVASERLAAVADSLAELSARAEAASPREPDRASGPR
jgi:hypothetical protein